MTKVNDRDTHVDTPKEIEEMVELTLRNRRVRFESLGFPEFTAEEIDRRRVKFNKANKDAAKYRATRQLETA